MTIEQNKQISIEAIKTKLLDNFLLYGSLFAAVVFMIPQIPLDLEKLNWFNYFDLANIIALFIIYYNRKKVSLPVKTAFILFTAFSFFIADLYQNGLYSTLKALIVFIPFLGVLVYEIKWTAVLFLAAMFAYSGIALGYLNGHINPELLDPALNIPYKWIVNGIILSLVCLIIAMFINIFNKSLLQIIEQQDESYEVLKQQDYELKQNIEEKNVLLQEIHHRVKNNLAVVSGLLDLQSHVAPDEFSKTTLRESTNRILSISKVHELLYQSDDVSRINFRKYIEELAEIIINSFNKTGNEIHLNLDIHINYLNVNHGVPVGIILNELLTNTLKHGFNRSQECYKIQISAFEEGDHFEVTYQDNGSGVIEMKTDKKPGLGKTLIESLLTQIEADSHLNTEGKYMMSFRFPKLLS